MTREEAIKQLEAIKSDYHTDENDILYGKDIQALNMAIRVLETERPSVAILDYNPVGINKLECENCNQRVSKHDLYCRRCGAVLYDYHCVLPEGEEE